MLECSDVPISVCKNARILMANLLPPRHPENITKSVGEIGNSGFLGLSIAQYSTEHDVSENWMCFSPQVRGWETLSFRKS
jgi:hypothetical protein